jgi:hypothetical protein
MQPGGQAIPTYDEKKREIISQIANKAHASDVVDVVDQPSSRAHEVAEFVNSWLNQDPDKEPFKPKLQTDVKLVFNRSFSNLKRNPSAHKLIKGEAKKLLRLGTVEGYLKDS